ncbi:hypothetical protein ACLOJK_027983 [Asimina triloba]
MAATAVQYRDRLLTEEERQVAKILLELPKLLEPFRSPSGICWGRKRRRSSFPTSPSLPCCGETALLKAETASPATPLSFSPSDADEDSRPKVSRRRDFRKKSHKELKEEVARLCAERIQLEQEYKKRSKYRNELQTLNLRLISQFKEKQNQPKDVDVALLGWVMGGLQFAISAFYQPHDLRQCRRSLDLIGNINLTAAAAFQGNPGVDIKDHLLLRTNAEDATRGVPYRRSHEGQQQPSLALEENQSMAVGILDLNAPPEEAIAFDFLHIPVQFKKNKAAIAAEARKKRMEINRGKSFLALKESRL